MKPKNSLVQSACDDLEITGRRGDVEACGKPHPSCDVCSGLGTEECPKEFQDASDVDLEVVMPHGAMGGCRTDLLEAALRAIAESHASDDELAGLQPSKYGTTVDNDVFMMHPYCWCEKEDCPWCRLHDSEPNFRYKPTGLEVRWYKYIGRGMETNREYRPDEIAKMLSDCLRTAEEKPR